MEVLKDGELDLHNTYFSHDRYRTVKQWTYAL